MDCCVEVYGFFRTIPTVESYGVGVFCSRQNPYIGYAVLSKSDGRGRGAWGTDAHSIHIILLFIVLDTE